MQLVKDSISIQELKKMTEKMHGNLVKAVVDIEQQIMAVDGEMHADLEENLLENESQQEHLWGINIHPDKIPHESWIEFDSLINLRPSQGNRSRYVENSEIRKKVITIVEKLVKK